VRRLLLDAHTLLWWLAGDEQLSKAARQAIERADAPLIGAGTLVEIAVKRSLGKLVIGSDWTEQVQSEGFGILAITWAHLVRLQDLPYPKIPRQTHRDPFDRLLAAQALTEQLTVATKDPALAAYGVTALW
jgi:PIN domain nuclease of toxin-antitoxin system